MQEILNKMGIEYQAIISDEGKSLSPENLNSKANIYGGRILAYHHTRDSHQGRIPERPLNSGLLITMKFFEETNFSFFKDELQKNGIILTGESLKKVA